MAKNQAKQESEDLVEPWTGDEAQEFGEASNDAGAPIKERMLMRHKIEDLLKSRRLKKQLADYDAFDVDERDAKARRLH